MAANTGDTPPLDQEQTTSVNIGNRLALNHAHSLTVAKKHGLIFQYAKLFGNHMETTFPDPTQRMVALSVHIEQQALSGTYNSISALHDDYDMHYETYLEHSPDLMRKVGRELSQFAIAQHQWWPQCLTLPDQAERLSLVKAVVEAVKENREASPDQLWAAMKGLVSAARGGANDEDSDDDLFEG